MRRDYVQPGNLWPQTHAPTPSQFRDLDQAASEGVNGDGGGAYAPEDILFVGGQGIAMNAASLISGQVTTVRGGAMGGALVLGDNDWPQFSAPQSLTRVFPLRDFFSRYDQSRAEAVAPTSARPIAEDFPSNESVPGMVFNPVYKAGTVLVGKATRLVFPIPPNLLVQGAQFLEFRLRMRVATPPPSGLIPPVLPGFRVVRCGPTGGYLGAANDLYVIPAWGAGVTYPADGLVIPSSPNGKQFRVRTAGTSGGSQPALFASAVPGQLVPDNTVVWVCESGPTGAFQHFCTMPYPTTLDAYFNSGNGQDIIMNADNGLVTSVIDQTTYAYAIEVHDPAVTTGPSGNIYTSIKLTLSGITQLVPVY